MKISCEVFAWKHWKGLDCTCENKDENMFDTFKDKKHKNWNKYKKNQLWPQNAWNLNNVSTSSFKQNPKYFQKGRKKLMKRPLNSFNADQIANMWTAENISPKIEVLWELTIFNGRITLRIYYRIETIKITLKDWWQQK